MSGIVGMFNLDGSPVDPELLRKMTEIQAHRGPDDYGFVMFNTGGVEATSFKDQFLAAESRRLYNLGLGHCRLATIDPSTVGHQPMGNKEGNLWIIHDGEVYNYIEIKEELKNKGYRFKSNTDTEVILYSYQEWGAECLERFNGTWAFAIWDGRRKRLFCARDHFGIKPFYYYYNGKSFIFASEVKALLLHPQVTRKVNPEMVYDYLVFETEESHDVTFFDGIKQLSPAYYLSLNKGGDFGITRWWDVQLNLALGDFSGKKDTEYAAQLLALLEASIKLRLRSEAPVGVMLGGGLDSSSIACVANRLLSDGTEFDRRLIGERLKTFSCCFEKKQWNEKEFIDKVITETGAENYYTFPDADSSWEKLPRLVWHQEQPFNGAGLYAHWTVIKKAAAEGVKVLLNGQGGDECFAGYPNRQVCFLSQIAQRGRIVKFLKEAWRAAAFSQQRITPLLIKATYPILPFYLRLALRSAYHRLFGAYTANATKALNPSFAQMFSYREADFRKQGEESSKNLQKTLYQCMFTLTIPQALRRENMNSMAFSIEKRFPFLDHRLVEYAFSLPATQKIRNGWTKWVLRQAMEDILPNEVRWKKGKWFISPEMPWLQQERGRIRELFSTSTLGAEFINSEYIVDNLLSQEKGHLPQLWRVINLELWLRTFFGGK